MALARGQWAGGTQSVLTAALSLLISSVVWIFVVVFLSLFVWFFFSPGLNLSLSIQIYSQYNFSSPILFTSLTYPLSFCVLFSFHFFLFCSSLSFVLFAHHPASPVSFSSH